MRRVLVTGAGGFVGSHFAPYLAGRGFEVRAIDVHPPARPPGAGVDFRVQDIRELQGLAAALEGVETVFNLASVHLDVHATPEQFESVNVRALEQLIRLSAAARVRRLVQVSSVGVYGHVAHPPAAEDAPLNPDNEYERTKAAGERAAREAAQRTGLDLVIVRPSWVYGVGCPRTRKLIGSLRKRRFFFIGRGNNLRHPIYIDDLLTALELTAAAGPEVAGSTFNIAGPRWMTVEEMVGEFARALQVPPPALHAPRWLGLSVGWAAEQVSAVVGAEPPVSRRTLAFFENDNAFDIGAARHSLGFDPKTDLAGGARAVIASYSAAS
ncbi:MAG: NAD-dependent epimerase/dehydratase family protein [Gammaproteobacteria bacterium]|nr:NAD-dependent epimerase/dehydratase family protein [Gammaproteobacteria bacterium]MDE2261023.1 NAD-dependent epimerase/dehydratase family protein [Gammaproteobacteria bacterium]